MFLTSNPGLNTCKGPKTIKCDLQKPVFLYFAGTRKRERLMRLGRIKSKSYLCHSAIHSLDSSINFDVMSDKLVCGGYNICLLHLEV